MFHCVTGEIPCVSQEAFPLVGGTMAGLNRGCEIVRESVGNLKVIAGLRLRAVAAGSGV